MAEYSDEQINEVNRELDEADADIEKGRVEEAKAHIARVREIVGDPEGPGE